MADGWRGRATPRCSCGSALDADRRARQTILGREPGIDVDSVLVGRPRRVIEKSITGAGPRQSVWVGSTCRPIVYRPRRLQTTPPARTAGHSYYFPEGRSPGLKKSGDFETPSFVLLRMVA